MGGILAAALAGIIATPHCAAMCGGFATACGKHTRGMMAWHTGRLGTYALLGVVAGAFGRVLPGPAWLPAALSAVLLTWFAASFAGLVPQPSARLPGLTRAASWLLRREGVLPRVAFGALNGLLPCGMVYAALALAVAAGSPEIGALTMVAFGLGTVPGLSVLALGMRRFAARGIWQRRALAALMLAVGAWSIGSRVVRADDMADRGTHSAMPAAPHTAH